MHRERHVQQKKGHIQPVDARIQVRSSHPFRRIIPLLILTLLTVSVAVGFYFDARMQSSESRLHHRQAELESEYGLLVLRSEMSSSLDLNVLRAASTAMGISVRVASVSTEQPETWAALEKVAGEAGMLSVPDLEQTIVQFRS